jgi:tetratricopeptide (TPR) repeat protein
MCFGDLQLALSSTGHPDRCYDDSSYAPKSPSGLGHNQRIVKKIYTEDVITDDIECYAHRERSLVDDGGENDSKGDCPVMMCFPCKSPPNNWDAYSKGMYLKNTGRLEAAIKELGKIGETESNYVEAQYHKGSALAVLGRYDEAMACFRVVEVMEPGRIDVKLSISDVLKYMKKYDQALAMINEVERMDSENDILHYKRMLIWGVYLKDIGRFEEAIGVFDEISEESPNYSEMKCQKGWALSALGRYKEAMECFHEVAANYPIRPAMERKINGFMNNMEKSGQLLPLSV